MSKGWRRAIVAVFFVWLIGLTVQKVVWPNIARVFVHVGEVGSTLREISQNTTGEVNRKEEATLPTEGITSLQLRSVNGTVQLETTEEKTIRYEATIWAKGPDAQRKVDQTGVQTDKQDSTLIIASKHAGIGVSNEGINYTIYVPEDLNIQINLTNGTVNGRLIVDNDHKYAVDLVNGEIELQLELVDGAAVTATYTNGDFKIQEAGGLSKASFNSSRGRVSAVYGDGSANVSIHAVNGSGDILVAPHKNQ